MAALLLLGAFLAAAAAGRAVGVPVVSDLAQAWSDVLRDGMGNSIPTRISIPSLGVQAEVVEVGRALDGSIATPARDPVAQAGWYGLGPAPGEAGTAIIVGHVDTEHRPAVFATLATLDRGDGIEVTRHDRQVARFAVDSVESFSKAAFPVERLFDRTDGPHLALVTCGGRWVGGSIGYSDNVIVFATLS